MNSFGTKASSKLSSLPFYTTTALTHISNVSVRLTLTRTLTARKTTMVRVY